MDAIWGEVRQNVGKTFEGRSTLDKERDQAILDLLSEDQKKAYNAIYDNNLITTSEAPPVPLSDGHGHLIPIDQMSDAQRRAYNDWITTNGQGAFTGVNDADTQYTKGVTDAQNTLAPKEH